MPSDIESEGLGMFPADVGDYLPEPVADALHGVFVALVDIERSTHELQVAEITLGDLAIREGAGQTLAATIAALDHVKALCDNITGRLTPVLGQMLQGACLAVGDRTAKVSTRPPTPRYDNRLIVSAIAARCADEVVDRETGETPPLGIVAGYVAERMAACTGSGTPGFRSWVKGPKGLAFHGLDIDDFRVESEPSHTPPRMELD